MCCDLLEISYLCGRINNFVPWLGSLHSVVICSKFPTFVVESTTLIESLRIFFGCDLLEISYLCGRINNKGLATKGCEPVVICSKFPTFVVESTTFNVLFMAFYCCDLLEISYLCGRINNIVCVKCCVTVGYMDY